MKKILPFILLGLLALCININSVHAQCFSSWKYKVPITLDNSSNSNTLTDYQVKLNVNTSSLVSAGKMNSSGSDIRFATSTCKTIHYWIESGMNSSNTVIWIKVPSITGSSKTTIDMYYGNSSASSTADADSVFMFYDDFDSKNTNKWTYTTGYNYRYNSGALGFSGDAGSSSKVSTHTVNTFPDNIIIESSLNKNDGCADHFIYLNKTTSGTFDWGSTSGYMRFAWNCSDKYIYGPSSQNGTSCSTNQTYDIKITVGSSALKFEDNKCSSVSLSATTFSSFYIYIGADQDNSSIYSDFYWLRVRKYTATEPTVSIGSETNNKTFDITVSGTTFCPGAGLTVTVGTSSITFNSGNEFTVQLSNASGSFASPVNIGKVTATSGSISATIPINTPAGTGYRVRVKSSSPSDSSGDNGSNITIYNTPSPDAGTNKSICLGGSTIIGYAGTPGSTYSWSPATGLSSNVASSPVANPLSTTTYILTEKNASGCVNYDTVVVEVTSPPAASAGPSRTVCPNQAVTIGTSAVSGNSYSWTSKPSGFTSSSAMVTVYPSTTTTYYLTETNVSSGCQKKDSVKITVNSSVAANRMIFKELCTGQSMVLGEPSTPGNSYSWTSNPSGFSSSTANPTVSPTTNTIYILKQTVTSTGCTRTDSIFVAINPLPTANAGTNQTICAGTDIQLGSTAVAGNTYSWTSIPVGYTSNLANPVVSPTATTTYYLTETNASTGCSKSGSVKVTVNPAPTAYTGADQVICGGSSIVLGDKAVSGNTYKWSPSNGLSSDTVANPTATPVTETTYTLTETINSTGCSKTNSVTIHINPQPRAYAGDNKTICKGGKVQLGTTATAGNSYSWSPTTGLSSDTISNPVAAPLVTTTYTLTETILSTGCKKTSTVTVKVNALPVAFTGGNKTICNGSGITLGTTAVTGYTYNWWPNINLSATSVSNPVASPTATQWYYLMVTNDSTGCTNLDSVKITVIPAPLADAGSDKTICSGEKTQIGSTSVLGMKYSWSPSAGLSSDAVSDPIASPFSTTTYTLTETNVANGCKKSSTVTVTVNAKPAANAGVNRTICVGESIQLGATAVPDNIYRWSPSKGLNSIYASNPIASPNETTVYYLTEINKITNCTKTDSVVITVLPRINTSIFGPTNICANSSATYTTNNNSLSTYTWSVKGGVITAGQNTDRVTVLWSAGAGAYIKLNETRNSCRDSATTKVEVFTLPNANWTSSKVGANTYRFQPVDSNFVSYLWDFGDGTTSTFANPTHTYAKDSIYMVSLTVQNTNSCKASKNGTLGLTAIKDAGALAIKLNIFPNPFKHVTNISYTLQSRARVNIQVYDLTGKQIAVLADAVQDRGEHLTQFNATEYTSKPGVYVVRILVDDKAISRQVIMVE